MSQLFKSNVVNDEQLLNIWLILNTLLVFQSLVSSDVNEEQLSNITERSVTLLTLLKSTDVTLLQPLNIADALLIKLILALITSNNESRLGCCSLS